MLHKKKIKRFFARLAILGRHFHIIILVVCVQFLTTVYTVDGAECFIEDLVFLGVLKCLIYVESIGNKISHFVNIFLLKFI